MEFLRDKQAAEYLGVGTSTIWLYTKQKKLKAIKLSERVCKFHSYVSSCFTFMFPLVSQTCFHLFHSKFPLGNRV